MRNMNAKQTVGALVKKMRLKANLTQLDLGKLAGRSKQAISLIEKGQVNPSIDTLCRLAVALKVRPVELLP